MKRLLQSRIRLFVAAASCAAAFQSSNTSAQVVNSTWLGDGVNNFSNGFWSDMTKWNPNQVPNNNGGTVYDVTIPFYDGGVAQFNGPLLDISPIVRNLTLVNRVFLTNQGQGITNITVTGTTAITTAPGHDGEYSALFNGGGTWLLGTLTNYDAGTHTIDGPFLFPFDNSTIGWRGADIVTNKATLFLGGANARLIDQDTNLNALRNLAVNMGGIEFGHGINFTTTGNFTNNGSLSLVTDVAGSNTTFTISGTFTNYDAGTHTLDGGFINVEVRDGVAATSTLRFANADIRTVTNAQVTLTGVGASIQDLTGQNAFRNLSGLSGGGVFRNAGTLIITPANGTFTNNGSQHQIDTGANITIQGDHRSMNGGTQTIGGPSSNGNTTLTITGNSIIEGGGLDMGGQPGITTQYHTELHVMNGLEFRGAYLTGTGTTFADVGLIQGSVFSPGHSPGQLTVEGSVSFDSSTFLQFEIGGATAGEEYDQLVQHGMSNVILGGSLDIKFVDGFDPTTVQNSDTFDIMTSDNNLVGTFANVADGDRLPTSDGIGSFVVTYANQKTVTLSNYAPVPALTGAVLRETHGARGDFDLPLALTGTPTVEPRGSGTHHLVLTFNNDIAAGDVNVSAPNGVTVDDTNFSGNQVFVTLTDVGNAQKVTVSLEGVTDEFDQAMPDTSFQFSVLSGDANGDRFVNAADATIVRSLSGQQTGATTFLRDFNLDGFVNAADATIARNASGSSVPPDGKGGKQVRNAAR